MSATATGTIDIAAPPLRVYQLVTDVARMGEWSPEATGARGASGEVHVGEKFWGTNRRGLVQWVTRCTVLAADPGRRFEFDVDFGYQGVSRWTYQFMETEQGCRVTESWIDRRGGPLGIPVRLFGQLVIPGNRAEHNTKNIIITLQRLKEEAESNE